MIAQTCLANTSFDILKVVIEGRNSIATFNRSTILSILFIPNQSHDIRALHAS